MPSYQYKKSYCDDKTILQQSYLHSGISYSGKTTCSNWIGVQVINRYCQNFGAGAISIINSLNPWAFGIVNSSNLV